MITAQSYIAFIIKHKYVIVIISWILIAVGAFIGFPAFFVLDGGGFEVNMFYGSKVF
jgi:hypothetical protein